MKAMNARITLGDYVLENVHSVTVDSSWKTLSDTASIQVPNMQELDKKVGPGDDVIIELGYDGVYSEDFRGYISSVSPDIPLRIDCMDEMWKLRQETISNSWSSTNLEDVLRYVAPDAQLENVPSVKLEPFRLDKVTRAGALDVIKEQFGLAVFYRGPQLYVGLPYGIDSDPLVNLYHFQKNVANAGTLQYRKATDFDVKVRAVSIMPDNTRQEVEVGDNDGELHTLHFYNLSKSELKDQAEQKLGLLKFDGYKGALLAFGFPNTQHSGIVDLQDGHYPERAGRYWVDRTVITYGSGGYRREIHLGKREGDSTQAP